MTFFPGETNAEALVTIIDNSVFEVSEMFTAIMTTSHTNVMFGEDTAVVTILDNGREFMHNYIDLLQDDLLLILVINDVYSVYCIQHHVKNPALSMVYVDA